MLSAHGLILVVHESKCMEIQKFRSSAKPWKFLLWRNHKRNLSVWNLSISQMRVLSKEDKLNTENAIKVIF